MIEKVGPFHPDKVADRIAGAITDLAYTKNEDPQIAVELLIGHGVCNIVIESSEEFTNEEIESIIHRISPETEMVNLKVVPQDVHLANNQREGMKCGDNGIFKGVPLTYEEETLSIIARDISADYPYDGKYIFDGKANKIIICQSNITEDQASKLKRDIEKKYNVGVVINPLGPWTGGTNVDTGAVNRKLGSDMGESVTGGGLWGKNYEKLDLSANIYAFMKAQEYNRVVEMFCAIGDDKVLCRIWGMKDEYIPIKDIISYAKDIVKGCGGFEAMAEWGLF